MLSHLAIYCIWSRKNSRHYRFSKDSTQWNHISATVNRKKYILKCVVYNTNIYDQKIASWFSKLYRSHTRSRKDKSIHHHDRDNPFCWPHIHYTDSKAEESNIVPSKEGDPLYHYLVSYEVCDVLKAFDEVRAAVPYSDGLCDVIRFDFKFDHTKFSPFKPMGRTINLQG